MKTYLTTNTQIRIKAENYSVADYIVELCHGDLDVIGELIEEGDV